MTGIPKITGKKVISTLRKAGFEVIRIKEVTTSLDTKMVVARLSLSMEVKL
jgi:hypothetical protein